MYKALQIPLPTLPTIAIRLLELFDDPHVELPDVVELLRSDPAIAARIIKAANSSAYGVGREVIDLQQAISLLGKTVVTSLALSFSLAEKSMQQGAAARLFCSYWLQAMTQAVTTEYLAKRYAKQQADEWFMTGLLASIGRLSLINHDPDLYSSCNFTCGDSPHSLARCRGVTVWDNGSGTVRRTADGLEPPTTMCGCCREPVPSHLSCGD